ncbi:uncharacterized protein LOC135218607 [Macrobrachium nipponense]|uniref:uncharacterized protein LOC135218607 n=1 Tax=Macrobrachium nipponense TaxID=159736 RepID=UPI0030C7EB9F
MLSFLRGPLASQTLPAPVDLMVEALQGRTYSLALETTMRVLEAATTQEGNMTKPLKWLVLLSRLQQRHRGIDPFHQRITTVSDPTKVVVPACVLHVDNLVPLSTGPYSSDIRTTYGTPQPRNNWRVQPLPKPEPSRRANGMNLYNPVD